jgi:pimeloyl-ACP methyl ester carboxylesterase
MTARPDEKSTIDRAKKRLASTVELWAPGLGAAWAERLWFTVPHAKRPAGPGAAGEAFPEGGEPFVVAVGGRRVRGWTWGCGPAVYLVHGWGGRASQLAGFVPPLVAAGHRVVAFDALSHGASDPGRHGRRRSTVPELAEVLAAVVREHGAARAVVAHSLGATATALAMRDGLAADRLAFVAPMADARPLLEAFVRALGFGPRVLARTGRRIERRAGLALTDIEVPRIARQVATPPLLVAHDRGDREVPWLHGSAVATAWPEATLLTTTGLGHRRILRDATVIGEVVSSVATPVRTATAS